MVLCSAGNEGECFSILFTNESAQTRNKKKIANVA